MADNNELQTSRLTDASAGNLIDNAIRDIEAALRIITGTTADTAQSAVVTLGDGDATPSISGGHRFLTANTGATSITDFDNEVNGKVIHVIAGDANTTVVDGATIKTRDGANVKLATSDTMTFLCSSSVWYEIARKISDVVYATDNVVQHNPSSGIESFVNFNSEEGKNIGGWTYSGTGDRNAVVPANGLYAAIACGCFDAAAGGTYRRLTINMGGTPSVAEAPPGSTAESGLCTFRVKQMSASDTITVSVQQDSGGALYCRDMSVLIWRVNLGG